MKGFAYLAAAMILAAGQAFAEESGAEGRLPATTSVQTSAVQRTDCANSGDPARCGDRREADRGRFRAAQEACADQEDDARRACLREAFCGKAQDRQRCETKAERRAQRRPAAKCTGKRARSAAACRHGNGIGRR